MRCMCHHTKLLFFFVQLLCPFYFLSKARVNPVQVFVDMILFLLNTSVFYWPQVFYQLNNIAKIKADVLVAGFSTWQE